MFDFGRHALKHLHQNRELKFTAIFLLSVAGFGLAIFTLAVIVDPYNIFGLNIFKPLILTNRNEKLRLLRQADPKPEIIVLGSSRVFKMDPQKIEQLTGKKTFNASVSFARPEEDLVMSKYIIQDLRITPKLFLVGVNLGEFNNDEIDSQTINNPSLRQYLKIDRLTLLTTLFKTFKERFNVNYLRDIFIAIFWNSRGFPDPIITFDKNGGQIFDKTRLPDPRASEANAPIALELLRNMPTIQEERKKYFENFLSLAKEKNIKVIVLLLPFSPAIQNVLREKTDYELLRRQFLKEMNNWQKKYSVAFFDFSNLQSWGGLNDDFDDGSHPAWRNLNLLLERVFKTGTL